MRALVGLAALALPFAALAPAGAVVPPPDHDGVLAAAQQVVAAGSPSYLFHAEDELGSISAAAGLADLRAGTAAVPDDEFRIGSISKMFLSVAVLDLVAERKVHLDDPIGNYLPGLLRLGGQITIRELLQHRAGLARNADFGNGHGSTWYPAINQSCDTMTNTVAMIQASDVELFPPGTSFSYSNAGYAVIGLLIDQVTGEDYGTFIGERILAPLGLTHTSFQEGAPVWSGPYLHGYGDFQPGRIIHKNLQDETDCNVSAFGAAGAGISTTGDLTTFLGALLQGRLLPPDLLAQMLDGQPSDLGPGVDYGLGVMVQATPCGTVVGHGGAVFGYQSDLFALVDGSRVFADAVPMYPGTDAVWNAVGAAENAEICGV